MANNVPPEYLKMVGAIPHIQEIRGTMRKFLTIQAGNSVVDLGCGIGGETRMLCDSVGSLGQVVGIDRDLQMIQQCAQQWKLPNVIFMVGDMRDLPFLANSFNAARTERTLQSVGNPLLAIREIWRVLKPQATFVAYEPNWGTLEFPASDPYLASAIRLSTGVQNPYIGQNLEVLFKRAFADVQVTPDPVTFNTLQEAESVLRISQTTQRAIDSQRITNKQAQAWRAELEELNEKERFSMTLHCFLVCGIKP